MVEIIPSILSLNIGEIETKIQLLEKSNVVKRIQIDIVDGQFSANKTVDPSFLENIETDLKLDFHLMTKNPIDWVEKCVRVQAERIIGQIEMMEDQIAYVAKVGEVGLSVGLALNIDTEISQIDPAIIQDLDVILLMSYPAGVGGQPFDPKVLKKIKELKQIQNKNNNPFSICVDGGINTDNIKEVVSVGANEVVVGKRLFEGDLKQNIGKLSSY